jgi:hypothetical protein
MRIRKAQHDDPNAWIRGRHALWPDYDSDGLAAETRTMLESHEEVCFVLSDESSQAVGFISSQSSALSPIFSLPRAGISADSRLTRLFCCAAISDEKQQHGRPRPAARRRTPALTRFSGLCYYSPVPVDP